MTITDWPLAERPREKLLQRGAGSLSDAELLAIFLRTGHPGRSAVALARDTLTRCGGLRALLALNQRDMCRVKGIGAVKFAQLQAALELGRRYLQEQIEQDSALESPLQTRQYLELQLRGRRHEVFCALFLDNQHRVIRFQELFRGTINTASVHPREVVLEALEYHAAAVIVAHNHPSGVAEPSHADREITKKISAALALVDIRLLDHMIIGATDTTSFAERGWL